MVEKRGETDATDLGRICLFTVDDPGRPVELCGLVTVSHVLATNILRDVREHITNLLGGTMTRYESLLDSALATATLRFRQRLADAGHDGAVGVRIAHPSIVAGGAEIVIYGTGFRWKGGG